MWHQDLKKKNFKQKKMVKKTLQQIPIQSVWLYTTKQFKQKWQENSI